MSYQIKIVQEGKTFYKCSICNEDFILKANLEKHVATEHQIQVFNQKAHIDSKLYIRPDPGKCEVKLPIQQIQKNGWACKVCKPEENFEHKFQMVTHLHEKHSEGIMCEPCQWCCELFKSPDQETVSPIFKVTVKQTLHQAIPEAFPQAFSQAFPQAFPQASPQAFP